MKKKTMAFKTLSFIIAMLMIALTLPYAAIGVYAAESDGDINGDKEADSSDATLVLRYDAGIIDAFPTDNDSGVKVGDIIKFGKYEQDNNTSNGKEVIEWIVLEVNDSELLLISRYGLDCNKYHDTYDNVTWEKCKLREWLNGTFYNSAFSTNEKIKIITSAVKNDDNSRYRTSGGNDTSDKVFALSIEEANKYFSTGDARKCIPTEYAKAQGVLTSSSYTLNGVPACVWWLRSPGRDSNRAAIVRGGTVDNYGYTACDTSDAVRPVLRIDFS